MTVELTVTSITVQPEISAANIVITPTFTSGGGLTAPILSISKNGVNIAPDELKNVDIEVPENTSELTNDSLVESVASNDNHIQVDNTDPKNPKLSFTVVDNENFVTDDEKADIATIPDKANTSDINTALGNKADLVNGLVPASQLPSYVDDVIEVANFASLPVTGENGKIYITQDDNLTYRWSGTGYAEISKSLALGETSSTAYRGDRGKTAYDHSQTTGNPHGTTASDVGASPLGHNHSGEAITPDAVTISGSYTDLQSADLAIGTIFYNTDQKCYMQKIAADVYHNFGSELPSLSKIGDNTNHLNGMPVYITSGAGNLNVVSLASSVIGKADAMATQDILNTGDKTGFYCYFGNVHKFPRANVIKSTDNTANWVEGAELHLCSEAGKLSTEVEAAPAKCPVVARITAVNGSNITLHFIPNKGINTTDLSDWDGSTSLIADTEKLFIRKTNGVIQEITKTDFYAVLDDYFYIRQLADRTFVNQNGGTIYHKVTPWTTAGTVSTSGINCTGVGTTITALMVGAKIIINGEERIIATRSSNTVFTVDSAFSTNYSGQAFAVYSVKFYGGADITKVLNYNGTGFQFTNDGSSFGAIYPSGVTPSGTNYFIEVTSDGKVVYMNAAATGSFNFSVNNAIKLVLMSDGSLSHNSGLYFYNAASPTADTVNDTRTSNVAGVVIYERCTGASATKGSGTWTEYKRSLVDGSNRFGTATDNTTIEADGTIKFNGASTVWGDIDFPILIRTTGVGIPTMQTFNGNLMMPQWAVNDFNQCESQEFVHEWKEGSTCYFHLHLNTNGLDSTDRYVKFEIEYAYSANGVWQFPAVVTTADILIPANTADRTQIIMPLFNFTPTNSKIGDHCVARLKRVASTGLAPTNNPFIPMLQMHVEKDTIGSRNMTTKA